MAIGTMSRGGALRRIVCAVRGRRSTIFVALSFYCWLSVAGIAADVQVNASDNFSDQGNFTSQSEPSVAVAGSLVVVGYNSTKQAANPPCQIGCPDLNPNHYTSINGYAFSTNGGADFTDGDVVLPPSGYKLKGDPALAFSPDNTTLYYASMGEDNAGQNSRLFVSASTSLDPVTFGVPVPILGLSSQPTPYQDKELIAVDTTQGPFRGRVYVAWTEFDVRDTAPNGSSRILFAASPPTTPLAFPTRIELSPLTAVNHGAMPAVAPNGDVYVVWGVFTPGTLAAPQTIQIVRSTDGGDHFHNPDTGVSNSSKTIASVTSTVGRMISKDINIRTRGFPYIAIDQTPTGSPTRGNIYVVFQATPPCPASAAPQLTSRSEIFFTRSIDGGKTWDTPRSISNGPAVTLNGDTTQNDNWMPSIAVSPVTGHIRVIFYSRREDPENNDIRVYDAGSTDGGLTWFNQPRSTIKFTPSSGYDPLLNKVYMGDYISLVAAGSNFYAAWTDTRNRCTPPGGAPRPCSPASPTSRGDQDVFFSVNSDPAGPDLAITPWGSVTGHGPTWQSPDIFVVDNGNNVVNAKPGAMNRLRARIRNVGNAAANGATVRFKYAPYFIGLTAAGFKEIAAPTVSLAAAGDASGSDLMAVPAQWDLTNPAENNGGIWPMPISAFQHFCVKVDVELSADVNQSNNTAQTNFVDLTADCCRPFRFLVGNPFERDITARLVVAPLPKGYSLKLEGGGGEQGDLFVLRPREIRVASAEFVRPRGLAKLQRMNDVVASMSMQVDNQIIGGLSARLAKANVKVSPPREELPRPRLMTQAPAQSAPAPAPATPNTDVTLNVSAAPALVTRTIASALRERQLPVARADEERGLVSSGPIPLNDAQMRESVTAEFLRGLKEATGQYYVSFKVDKDAANERSQVIVSVSIILENGEANSPIRGRVVPSNGSLEKQYSEMITQALK